MVNSDTKPVTRTRIKICGIRGEDAALAAMASGADAIGLNFYPPSIRYLDSEQARILDQVATPLVSRIGVFVDPQRDFVQEILHTVKLDQLQFHGDEPADFCESFGYPYVKVARVSDNIDLMSLEQAHPRATAILLDTHVGDLYGGTGKTFDWSRTNYGGVKPVILAGGLVAENVAEAIASAHPYAVDVASGVETDGEKDISKIIAFCHAVNQTFVNDPES